VWDFLLSSSSPGRPLGPATGIEGCPEPWANAVVAVTFRRAKPLEPAKNPPSTGALRPIGRSQTAGTRKARGSSHAVPAAGKGRLADMSGAIRASPGHRRERADLRHC
jgi:hypothetical protein